MMSMYGNHATENGMLMGGDLNGGMLMGATREEEDLGFGKWFKKAAKKVGGTVLKTGGRLAQQAAQREIQRRLREEEE